ncbi:MAG: efflux transporter outer membrane subunit [Alphaproteobacteria bacterium]
MQKFLTLSVMGLVMASSVAACTMVPNFDRPAPPVAESWHMLPAYMSEEGERAASYIEWRSYFNAPELWKVIGIALQNNRDLKMAALNIEEARAQYRISRSDLLPDINAGLSSLRERNTDNTSPTGRASITELNRANIGLSGYEIDVFGKIRSRNEAAINSVLASIEGRNAVRSALIAETANAYLQYLTDLELLNLTEKTLEAQRQTYNLLSESLRRGAGTAQDVARARTAVGTAEVNLHQYRRFVEQDKNALMLLMGVAHDESLLPNSTLNDIAIVENITVPLPSDIILARPDIRQAEYELMSRNADIGAARAAFFPSLTLTTSAGFASTALSSLFTGGAAGAWSFLPQITLPIFRGGENAANLDLAEIRRDKAVLNYEHSIQRAFREIADELAARATLTEQLRAQRDLVAAAQQVYNISDARYRSGVDSFLSVLDAQRDLYQFQQNDILTQQAYLANLVNLFRVMGGGALEEDNLNAEQQAETAQIETDE